VQFDAVEANDFAGPIELAMHEPAESLADITVDRQHQKLDPRHQRRQRGNDGLAGGMEPRMFRIAAPGEGNGDAGDIVEVDFFETAADGGADPSRSGLPASIAMGTTGRLRTGKT